MPPIVACSVTGIPLKILEASVEAYCPEVEFMGHVVERSSFGKSFNEALDIAFQKYDEALIANDDIVLTPESYKLLMEDVEALKKEHGDTLGIVSSISDSIRFPQNIRYQQSNDEQLVNGFWTWEGKVREDSVVGLGLAWVSKKAFETARIPHINWFSEDIWCLDLRNRGFRHFISRSYVHHAGSFTIGKDYNKNYNEARKWMAENRQDMFDIFCKENDARYEIEEIKKKNLKICVYAISKNEEKFVKRFCESAKAADLIVIADTGSSDNTVSIARECGANVHELCITPWRFDKARDAALALVPKDFDICVSLDLDEMLQEGWREEIERVWGETTTRLRYMYDWGNGLEFLYEKIHARHGYHWHHPCHEYPMPDGRITEVWAQTNKLLVKHFPDAAKSRGQYLDLLALSVKEDPFCTRNAFYYARELHFHGKHDESIVECKRYLALPNSLWHHERCYAMRVLGKCYEAKGERGEAEMWYHRAVAEAPQSREPWMALAVLFYHQSRWAESYAAAVRALQITDREPVYTCDPECWGALPHDYASIAAWHLGLTNEALLHSSKALEYAPDDLRLQNNAKLITQSVKPT